ncbi:MAG: PD40 domain-containing protein, partial [Clostridia bacterium]|nr:PD40 domain-containing protein [Clostridia bacterium]
VPVHINLVKIMSQYLLRHLPISQVYAIKLAYCAFRQHDGRTEVDVYTIPASGGEETRLTGGGFNDGPEYSPDGKHIWFNSTRSGLMQIWRMNRDGSEQTQMTDTHRQNWFGHISPDGKKVVYLSYRADDLEAAEHLPNMQVELWMMNADGSSPHRLLSLFGGQGSINVNSWAPDSRHIAFVSYELLPGNSIRTV